MSKPVLIGRPLFDPYSHAHSIAIWTALVLYLDREQTCSFTVHVPTKFGKPRLMRNPFTARISSASVC